MNKLLSALLIISPICNAEDMMKYMETTDSIASAGKYQEALDRHIWFHEHALEHEPGMYGVRLSFALSKWYKLGQTYPPALNALIEIRDNKTAIVISGIDKCDLFDDVSAINITLSENHKTIKLFNHLEDHQPSLASQCWRTFKHIAIEEKEYTLIKKYIANLVDEYDEAERRYIDSKKRIIKKDYPYKDRMISSITTSYIEKTIELMNIAISINDLSAADSIKQRSLKLTDDPRISKFNI
jgi:hypothetical protein